MASLHQPCIHIYYHYTFLYWLSLMALSGSGCWTLRRELPVFKWCRVPLTASRFLFKLIRVLWAVLKPLQFACSMWPVDLGFRVCNDSVAGWPLTPTLHPSASWAAEPSLTHPGLLNFGNSPELSVNSLLREKTCLKTPSSWVVCAAWLPSCSS